eukprot:scaffold76827_cov32-Tisochrysis_lutea.AAC.1
MWTNARTGRRLQWIKYPEVPMRNVSEKGPHLGLGLLDWDNHVKALQAKWILNYLDARQAQWKQVLDAWFCRTNMGRAAVLSTIPTSKLTDGITGAGKLPAFWKQALKNIRELELTPLKTSREGLLSQPMWGSPTHPGPNINPTWAKLWNRLQCNTIH